MRFRDEHFSGKFFFVFDCIPFSQLRVTRVSTDSDVSLPVSIHADCFGIRVRLEGFFILYFADLPQMSVIFWN